MSLRAYECFPTYQAAEGRRERSVHGGQVIHAQSASKARYQYLLRVGDCYPDMKITDIGVKSLGPPRQSESFRRTAESRGLPFARIGMAIEVAGRRGVIVDRNDSANFDVLFDDGTRGNCHPRWMTKYFDEDGMVIAEFGGVA